MFAGRLIEHMKSNGERMSELLDWKVRTSKLCRETSHEFSFDEGMRDRQVCQHLTAWLLGRDESPMERCFFRLGVSGARFRVPYSDIFWSVRLTKEFLWAYILEECLIEDPVEVWRVELLHSINRFFDRALYVAAIGYEKATD